MHRAIRLHDGQGEHGGSEAGRRSRLSTYPVPFGNRRSKRVACSIGRATAPGATIYILRENRLLWTQCPGAVGRDKYPVGSCAAFEYIREAPAQERPLSRNGHDLSD